MAAGDSFVGRSLGCSTQRKAQNIWGHRVCWVICRGLLCIGLADERLQSNALLGTTAVLQLTNWFFLGLSIEIHAAPGWKGG